MVALFFLKVHLQLLIFMQTFVFSVVKQLRRMECMINYGGTGGTVAKIFDGGTVNYITVGTVPPLPCQVPWRPMAGFHRMEM